MPKATLLRTANALRKRALARWRLLSLATKFLVVAAAPIVCNSLILGAWVSRQVEEGVVHEEAAAGALYVEALLEPVVRRMTDVDTVGTAATEALNALTQSNSFRDKIANYKVWSPSGTILFSKEASLAGKQFPVTGGLKEALEGKVAAEFDSLDDEENSFERDLQHKLLEMYVPIHDPGTGKVIAVAEIYQIGDKLGEELTKVRIKTWGIVALLTTVMTGLLFEIVRQGSITIGRQRRVLLGQVKELSRLLGEVSELRRSVDDAHKRAATSTERFIRRVGSDLHDGPAQYIGLALLNLEDLDNRQEADGKTSEKAIANIDNLLTSALDELRGIAAGLAPPEIDKLNLAEALRLAVRNHEWRTGTAVTADISSSGPAVPEIVKINLFRFAQEALNNAFAHAKGVNQALRAIIGSTTISIEVSDDGPGVGDRSSDAHRPKLGLAIMKDRIEALGGKFEIIARSPAGTTVKAVVDLNPGALAHG